MVFLLNVHALESAQLVAQSFIFLTQIFPLLPALFTQLLLCQFPFEFGVDSLQSS